MTEAGEPRARAERVEAVKRPLRDGRKPAPAEGDRVQLGLQSRGARLADQQARRERHVVGRAVHAGAEPGAVGQL
ncbi:MAG: hypothetical protein ACRDN8_15910, partial [Thermoleophilaceae bacterium]